MDPVCFFGTALGASFELRYWSGAEEERKVVRVGLSGIWRDGIKRIRRSMDGLEKGNRIRRWID